MPTFNSETLERLATTPSVLGPGTSAAALIALLFFIGTIGKSAYAALTTALELRVLHDDHFAPPMTGPTEAELIERIMILEGELDKPQYVSLVRRFLQQKTKEPPDSRGFSEFISFKARLLFYCISVHHTNWPEYLRCFRVSCV